MIKKQIEKLSKVENLLLELMNIPSVSRNEKVIGEFLVARLHGFQVKKQAVSKDRFNIIAKKGNPKTYIVVHMDTVPGDVHIRVTKDRIYGRGAMDNKGNLAGAIMAAEKLENIGLVFTVGEEDDFIGAKKIRIKKGNFIVMEGTNMRIMRGQRGLIAADIIASGKQMHSSLKFKKTESAVYNLWHALDVFYAKNWTAFNAIITEGGEADNVVVKKARAKILIRPENISEYEKILRFLEESDLKNVSIEIKDKIEPCSSNLVKSGGIVPYFSEMAFFKNSLLFGAGNIAQAHSENEYIERKELNRLEAELIRLVGHIERR